MGKTKTAILILALVATGCTSSTDKTAQPPARPKPPHQKPIFEKDPEVLVWNYQETLPETKTGEYTECEEPFKIGSQCETKGSKCRRKAHLMNCVPEDLQVRVYGTVVDDQGAPLAGVRVMGGLGVPGYSNLTETVTDSNGDFMVKAGMCLNAVYTQLDGYTSPFNYFVASMLTRCRVENYEGVKGVVVTMKPVPRTFNPAHQPIKNSACLVTGKVVDQSGTPIEGAIVTASVGMPSSKTQPRAFDKVKTDTNGEYVIPGDEPCADSVSARKDGYTIPYESRALATALGGKPADIVLNKNN